MWWKEPFINRRNWILANCASLSLTMSEAFLVIMLDFMQECQLEINLTTLSKQINTTEKEVDQLLGSCMQKGYVAIQAVNGKIEFDLSGVFEAQQRNIQVSKDIFTLFEQEFKRLLTEKEMAQLNNWSRLYHDQMIVYALREALLNNKLSFFQIDKILTKWKQEKVTVAELEKR